MTRHMMTELLSSQGIRYLSRLYTQWECWAVYEDIELEEIVREPISLNDPALQRVADLFELKVF